MQMSLIQGAAMIRLASSSSQEANVMVSLSLEWLKWLGEVNVQCSVFGYGGRWKWSYSCVKGTEMSCIWCKEALGTKRLKNARGRCEFHVFGKNVQQWWFLIQFWVLVCFRACVFLKTTCVSIRKRLEIFCTRDFWVIGLWLSFLILKKSEKCSFKVESTSM